jgi:hypothetical protein
VRTPCNKHQMLAVFVTKLPHHHKLYKGAFTYDMRFLGR